MKFALIAAVCLASGAAEATPPPVGSAAAEELSRFTADERAWIARQHDQMGRYCCDLGDYDSVTVRQEGDNLQIKAKHPDKERGIPDGWHTVQDDRRVDLKGQHNIPDVMAAWFYRGNVQCVIIGSGF